MSDGNKALIRDYITAAAAQDWATADTLHAASWRQYNPDGSEFNRDDFAQKTTAFFVGFPDLAPSIHDQIAEDDKVVTHLTWSGTHTGDFMGIPPSGNHGDFEVVRIDRIAGGKIAETRVMFDAAKTMRQLGVLV